MTETETTRVIYPSADELDTGGWSESSGYGRTLYLIPAAESDSGLPEVTYHGGVGNRGTPMSAWHNRWTSIATYGARVIGESVLEALQQIEDDLIAESERYLGSEWDGSNYRGHWRDNGYDRFGFLCPLDGVGHYWDAADWLSGGSYDWEDAARDAGVDPERALRDGDLPDLIATVSAALEASAISDGHQIFGAEDAVQSLIDEYRERQEVEVSEGSAQ